MPSVERQVRDLGKCFLCDVHVSCVVSSRSVAFSVAGVSLHQAVSSLAVPYRQEMSGLFPTIPCMLTCKERH